MTITGTLNPEDDSIFLKVQVSDKDGNQSLNPAFISRLQIDLLLEIHQQAWE